MEFASVYLDYLNHTRNLASITPVLVPVSIFYTISIWWYNYAILDYNLASRTFHMNKNNDKSKIVFSITI